MPELEKQILPAYDTQNILDLPYPDQLYCDVRHYRGSHALMRIEIRNPDFRRPDPPLQLIFFIPRYFSGLLGWLGAEINVASRDEQAELWQALGKEREEQERTGSQSIDSFLKHNRLYSISTVAPLTHTIKIIAGKFILSEERITIDKISRS